MTRGVVLGVLVLCGCGGEPPLAPCIADRFDAGLAPWTAEPGSSISVTSAAGGLAIDIPATAALDTAAAFRRPLDLTDGAFEIELVEGSDPGARVTLQIGLGRDTCTTCSMELVEGWIYGTRYDPMLHRFVRFSHDSDAMTLTLQIFDLERGVVYESIAETTASFDEAVPWIRVISGERAIRNAVATRLVWDNAQAFGPHCAPAP